MHGELAFSRLAWRNVLVVEVFYFACLTYGLLLSGPRQALHHEIFGLLIGFSWTPVGVAIGALDMLVLGLIYAGVWTWLHNASLVRRSALTVAYMEEEPAKQTLR